MTLKNATIKCASDNNGACAIGNTYAGIDKRYLGV